MIEVRIVKLQKLLLLSFHSRSLKFKKIHETMPKSQNAHKKYILNRIWQLWAVQAITRAIGSPKHGKLDTLCLRIHFKLNWEIKILQMRKVKLTVDDILINFSFWHHSLGIFYSCSQDRLKKSVLVRGKWKIEKMIFWGLEI